MKTRSPKRTLKMTAHEAVALRRLLLTLLDRDFERLDIEDAKHRVITETMATKIYDKMSAITGRGGPYDKADRIRKGFRRWDCTFKVTR